MKIGVTNVKKICSIVMLNIVFFVCFFSGCTTTRTDTSSAILEHQAKLIRLEETVRLYDAAVGGAIAGLDELSARSKSMGGTIEETIILFDEYQRRVDAIIQSLSSVRSEAQLSSQGDSSTNSADNPENIRNDSITDLLLQGN